MQEVIRFALLGFGVGALYALASQGLIVIYRGSGVLNFALGAIGMVGAYFWWELTTNYHWAFAPALIVGVLISALIGAAVHLLIMRPLRAVSPIVRVIATLGVLITIQSIAVLRYQANAKFVPSKLPTNVWHLHGTIVISADRVILLGIAAVFTLGLWALYRYTVFGLGTTAVAENERAASSLGWSPDRIATINWALGCGLAGLAAILIIPIVTLQPQVLTNLVLAATAAALVAAFRSFPVAFAAGLGIGIVQTEINRYVHQPGLGDSVPFILIVIWLMFRGQALPLRDYLLQRLPTVGSGRPNWPAIAFGVAVSAYLIAETSPIWIDAFTVTFCVAIVLHVDRRGDRLRRAAVARAVRDRRLRRLCRGQVHGRPRHAVLARHVDRRGLDRPARGAVRNTCGANTRHQPRDRHSRARVGDRADPVHQPDLTGGVAGTQIKSPHLFGFNIDSASHPTRYGLFVLACFVIIALAVGNVRRGRTGRRLIAVRTNERAAAALGISVPGAKLYAFGLSAGIAAVGGILLAFRSTSISYSIFTNFTSINDVGFAMIGGIGYLIGPVIGGTLAPGGLDTRIFDALGSGIAKYVPLIGGVSLIVLLLLNQNGIAKESIAQIAWVRGKLAKKLKFLAPRPRKPMKLPTFEGVERVPERTLEVHDVTVRYGGTTAVDSVSLTVKPGQIVGLIGPNGAGKTTLIDAVTGFTQRGGGQSRLRRQRDRALVAGQARSRAGLGRSFQSLELFEDSTVFDNLRAASDPRDLGSYVRDLVYPFAPPLPGQVVSAIKEFRLEDDLDRLVEDLSYGQRRLLAIARAVATRPSVLLLDEPAAGLGDVESAELAHLVRRLASTGAWASCSSSTT